MKIQLCLKFSGEEIAIMAPSFAFGDAGEQLSYAIYNFGSKRVADLIIKSGNEDIAAFALAEAAKKFTEGDKTRIKLMIAGKKEEND